MKTCWCCLPFLDQTGRQQEPYLLLVYSSNFPQSFYMWFICMPLNPTSLFRSLLKSINCRGSSFNTKEENGSRKYNFMALMAEFLQINKDQIGKAGRAARRPLQHEQQQQRASVCVPLVPLKGWWSTALLQVSPCLFDVFSCSGKACRGHEETMLH